MSRCTPRLLLIPLGCAIHLQNPPPWKRPKEGEQAGTKAIWEGNFNAQRHSMVGPLPRGTMARVVADAPCLRFWCLANRTLSLGYAELVAEWQLQESSFQLGGQRELCIISSVTHN